MKKRTASDFVSDMRRVGRNDEQIRAVASTARGGVWAQEVDELLNKPASKKKNDPPKKAPETTEKEEEVEPAEEEEAPVRRRTL